MNFFKRKYSVVLISHLLQKVTTIQNCTWDDVLELVGGVDRDFPSYTLTIMPFGSVPPGFEDECRKALFG